MTLTSRALDAVERGWVPDALVRAGIRRLCARRLREARRDRDAPAPAATAFLRSLREGPIAPRPEAANAQHYELPAELFEAMLGPRLKYSCCEFASTATTLPEAETAALDTTVRRARLADGQDVLELGCGWGSLTLWMAERYPRARITAVSNSATQRRYLLEQAGRRGCRNVDVVTADINDFAAADRAFDRVVSVEMFEHVRNHGRLLDRIAGWLRPSGKLFVHVFCHRELCYPFDTAGDDDWMGRHFFTGGMMPGVELLKRDHGPLRLQEHHQWNGNHYRRTAEAWLANLDARRDDVTALFAQTFDRAEARRRVRRWRMFLLAVAELFGYRGGAEWFVAHYLWERAAESDGSSPPIREDRE